VLHIEYKLVFIQSSVVTYTDFYILSRGMIHVSKSDKLRSVYCTYCFLWFYL